MTHNPKASFYSNPTVLIAVTGGTASGKTTFCETIAKHLQGEKFVVIPQDAFYKPLTPEENANVANYNFDSPDAFDWDLIVDTLKRLKAKKSVSLPIYDYTINARKEETIQIERGDVVMFEGLYTFYPMKGYESYLDLFDLKIFIDSDNDTRLGRRIKRDMEHRGRTLDSILEQYKKFVKPAYDQWVYPLRKKADIIVPWGELEKNSKIQTLSQMPSLKMIIQYIESIFQQYTFKPVQSLSNVEFSNEIDGKKSAFSDEEN